MRPSLAARLAARHAHRARAARVRSREALEHLDAVTVVRNGRRLVNFCANDYLGLSFHPAVAEAFSAAGGAGAGASALVSGYTPRHAALERELADFLGFEAGLVVSSGYQANLSIGQALLERGEAVLADRLNHASLNDGVRLAAGRLQRYRHADPDDAAARVTERTGWIASDGVFSMDGDLAPLARLVKLADDRGLGVWLDDAHGFGVLGSDGRGILEHEDVAPSSIDVHVITFGKALGTHGALIAGSSILIEELVNSARGVIYSTAISPPVAAATRRSLKVLQREGWRREQLHESIQRFKQGLQRRGLPSSDSSSAIQPIAIGDDERALSISARLAECGFLVRAIRPPTVPEGTARLRVTLSAAHRHSQIDSLLDALDELLSDKAA